MRTPEPENTADGERPRSPWKKRLVAFGGSLLVSLVIAEIAVRLLYGGPLAERLPILRIRANPHRGWEMMPSEVHYTYHHPVAVNAHGLRGAEIGAKGADEVRVLALGDSLIYGQGVGDEETLPFYLERALEERDGEQRDWTVINAGHRAYDTAQELGLLSELGAELAPDVVVLFWFWNDLSERDIEATNARLAASGPIAFDTGSEMQGLAKLKWYAQQLVRRSAFAMVLHDALGKLRGEYPFDALKRTGMRRLERHLEEFARLRDTRGHEVVFAVVPDRHALGGDHPTLEIVASASELAAKHRMPIADLHESLRELQRATGSVPIVPFDEHYAPESNRAMAEWLAGFLLEAGLPTK